LNKELRNKAEGTRLNKFIADSGYCSRRNADELVFSGLVSVNQKTILTPGYQVKGSDMVYVEGKKIKHSNKVYILLNKPKKTITTTSDEFERRTVLDLVADACAERVFPVGRLDKDTTGILILTNDGDLSNLLAHPSSKVRKVYRVKVEREVEMKDLIRVRKGIMLDDGIAKADDADYDNKGDKTCVVVIMHSGKNRIVRRIFEKLGYEIKSLDRIFYAGLTLKGLSRGSWRFLTAKEVKELYEYKLKIEN
jgi:23S rRNA pseudouridine2605 synthase